MTARKRSTALVVVAMVGINSYLAPPSFADEGSPLPDAGLSIGSDQLATAMEPATESMTVAESRAVDAYLDAEPADLGVEDLQVGTVVDDGLKVVVVAPEEGVEVNEIVAMADPDTGEVGVGAKVESSDTPEQLGPGMGTWPDWGSVPSYSVRLDVNVKYGSSYEKVGDAIFQTKKRRLSNDGSSVADTWQIVRYAVGRPVTAGDWRVHKLWLSQDVTDATATRTRSWEWGLTAPDTNSQICDSSSVDLGPWSFGYSDCSDYDVWTGRVGHQRMEFDQGAFNPTGQKAAGYRSGFTIDNGVTPGFTYYEFVTFSTDYVDTASFHEKCTSTRLGPSNDTAYLDCYFPEPTIGGGGGVDQAS